MGLFKPIPLLKHLFTSKARIKLLKIFLLHPEGEYFVRELTRELDEQINSVRRELENLQELGLLKYKSKNRKKFYTVNTKHLLFKDLRSIFLKATQSLDEMAKKLKKMGDVKFLLFSGSLTGAESELDILIVGKMSASSFEAYLEEMKFETPLRHLLLTEEDFHYRLKGEDPLVTREIANPDAQIVWNQILEVKQSSLF